MSEKKTEMVTNRRSLLKLAAVTGISMAVQTSAIASQKTETDCPKAMEALCRIVCSAKEKRLLKSRLLA